MHLIGEIDKMSIEEKNLKWANGLKIFESKKNGLMGLVCLDPGTTNMYITIISTNVL